MNPYSGMDFFSFFGVLFQRILRCFFGETAERLVSDEIQCIVLILLGASLSILGTLLVVKQMTMLANALSHTLLLGLVIAFLLLKYVIGLHFVTESFTSFYSLWIGAMVTGVLTTVLTQALIKWWHIQEDASIGLVFTTLFALGIILVTLYTKNMHLGVEAIMGNVDALHEHDIRIAGGFCLVIVCAYWFLSRVFFATAFDNVFSRSIGFPVRSMDYLLMVFAAGGAIASFRAVGILLFLSLLVGPVLIARLYVHRLSKVIFLSFCVSSFSSVLSVALARHLLSMYSISISTSGLIVCLLFIFYLTSVLLFESKAKIFYRKNLIKRVG